MRQVQLNLSTLGKVKTGVHTLQGILAFVAICIFIALSAQEGSSGGRGKYYCIAAVFTIPALIYLGAAPLWERTQRFCNVYAFLAVDAVFAVLWLAAWAAMVAWVRAGISAGAVALKIDPASGNCSTFEPKTYGTETKCRLGKDCAGVGVGIFILFISTIVISALYLKAQLKQPDRKPWLGKDQGIYANPDSEAAKDSAWSTDMHDDTAYPSQHNRVPLNNGNRNDDDEYQLLDSTASHSTETEFGRHPGARWDDEGHNTGPNTTHDDLYQNAEHESDSQYAGGDSVHRSPSTHSSTTLSGHYGRSQHGPSNYLPPYSPYGR